MKLPPKWDILYRYPSNGYRGRPSTPARHPVVENVSIWPLYVIGVMVWSGLIWFETAYLSYRFDLSWACTVSPLILGHALFAALIVWMLNWWTV